MEWTLHTFEELTVQQLYEILMARNAIFVVEQECAYQEIDGHDPKSAHLTLKDGEELVAYARLLPAGVKYPSPSIGRIIVNPAYRGSGQGRKLLEKSLDIMVNDWGAEEIKLQAQVYLRDFYHSFGFEETSAEYLDDGIPHVDMRMSVKKKAIKGSE
ncbi:GNAT family N-acetyltransferase [Jeotgalibacillus campisalis]|uniref:GNAT family acetyltransferase n=1 Tax=Jeotgalibacillus campisalis TaxID=220754 RepID=A0A0C2VXJ0_9BACL|nr:GNAT family N-acetyltransferase [Jeotgalibacillus campisalis]KIL48693.1 GNAT family acetyltransferase [Jeotgalibacillus campisalis]